MSKKLSTSARKVQDTLTAYGVTCHVVELPSSTRTAGEAAQAVGCQVGQIVKSLVFRGRRSHRPILVATSGANRVNERRLGELVDEPVDKADAEYVRQRTGFAIGGVPPVGHVKPLEILIDADLMQYEEIWAAAGTPHAVFKLTPAELVTITGGKVEAIT